MEEKSTKMTFELSDLSYEELLTTYKEINDFIEYLEKWLTMELRLYLWKFHLVE